MNLYVYIHLAQSKGLESIERLCFVEGEADGENVPSDVALVADYVDGLPEMELEQWWDGDAIYDWAHCDELVDAVPEETLTPLQTLVDGLVGLLAEDEDDLVYFNDATDHPGISVGPGGVVESIVGPARVKELAAAYDAIDFAAIESRLDGEDAEEFAFMRGEVLPSWRKSLQGAIDAGAYLLLLVAELEDEDD